MGKNKYVDITIVVLLVYTAFESPEGGARECSVDALILLPGSRHLTADADDLLFVSQRVDEMMAEFSS